MLEETKPATVESSVNAQAWGREGRTGGARRISRAAGPPCVTLQWSTRDITRLSRLAERTPPRTDPSCTRWDVGDDVSAQSPPAANGPSGGDVGGGEGQEGRGKSPHLPRDSAVKPNLLQKVNFRPATKPPLCLFPKFWPLGAAVCVSDSEPASREAEPEGLAAGCGLFTGDGSAARWQ